MGTMFAMCGITAIKTVLINRNGCITAELLRYQWVQRFRFISDILITEEEVPHSRVLGVSFLVSDPHLSYTWVPLFQWVLGQRPDATSFTKFHIKLFG